MAAALGSTRKFRSEVALSRVPSPPSRTLQSSQGKPPAPRPAGSLNGGPGQGGGGRARAAESREGPLPPCSPFPPLTPPPHPRPISEPRLGSGGPSPLPGCRRKLVEFESSGPLVGVQIGVLAAAGGGGGRGLKTKRILAAGSLGSPPTAPSPIT
ncbi:uncharacterized protein [Petaurus breviceps papuanus]|uniref:uncharacterized protein isoform X2 n=1 Tax=Petaurus breviceps papuanus TaxID=3040969 RepID=UPI0036DC8D17